MANPSLEETSSSSNTYPSRRSSRPTPPGALAVAGPRMSSDHDASMSSEEEEDRLPTTTTTEYERSATSFHDYPLLEAVAVMEEDNEDEIAGPDGVNRGISANSTNAPASVVPPKAIVWQGWLISRKHSCLLGTALLILSTALILGLVFGLTRDQDDGNSPKGSNGSQSNSFDPATMCNVQLGEVALADIRNVAEGLVNFTIGATTTVKEQADAVQVMMGPAQYHVRVARVCGSCSDYAETMAQASRLDVSSSHFWEYYCGPDQYGTNSTHSALLMYPVNLTTGQPLSGTRSAHMTFQSIRYGPDEEPSAAWPENFTQSFRTQSEERRFMLRTASDVFPMLVAASSGLIAIAPDPMGMGASFNLDRSYFTAMPVQQTAVVSYYAAQSYMDNVTNGCTQVDKKIITHGYSAGGSNAVFGTVALHGQSLEIVRCFTQGGYYYLPAASQGLFGKFEEPMWSQQLATNDVSSFCSKTSAYHALLNYRKAPLLANAVDSVIPYVAAVAAFVSAAYSNEAPFLANTGTGQTMLSEAYLEPVLQWIFEEKINEGTLETRFPTERSAFLSAFHPWFLEGIGNATEAGSLWCDGAFAQPPLLCQALKENSASSLFASMNEYPIEWCHSPQDDIIPFVSTVLFLQGLGKPNVVQYQPILPYLAPAGSHETSFFYCGIAVSTFLAASANDTGLFEPTTGLEDRCETERRRSLR